MNSALLILLAPLLTVNAATLSGQVTDDHGAPVAGARVFVETGPALVLQETLADASGRYTFDEVPPGRIGVFAYAPGHAFGGMTPDLGAGEDSVVAPIRLGASATLSGKIVDQKNKPVPGARISSVLLMEPVNVGIALAKLKRFGIEPPTSDDEGRFTLDNLPGGVPMALKVEHPSYAQEILANVTAGKDEVKITLDPGEIVSGKVLSRKNRVSVANQAILIRSSEPPYGTALTMTDGQGVFTVRLKPGAYLYQTTGSDLRSAGWEKLLVAPQSAQTGYTLLVAGTATIKGDVRDAVTDKPVEDARLVLESFGNPSDVGVTGVNGQYQLVAVEGENIVRLRSAPGYQLTDQKAVQVTAMEGQVVDLPTFWVRPLPSYAVQVIHEDGTPAAGAIVRLLKPLQYHWRVTGEQGMVSLEVAAVPEGGPVVGVVESLRDDMGALFQFDPGAAETARVQLFPFASVTGSVANGRNKPLEGVVVGGVFQGIADEDPLPLWRTVTQTDGQFSMNGVIPHVPMVSIAYAQAADLGRSVSYNLAPGERKDVGSLLVEGGQPGESLSGQMLDWRKHAHIAGPQPSEPDQKRPACVMYCDAAELDMVVDALEAAARIMANYNIEFAAVAAAGAPGSPAEIPVLQGTPPASATTYLLNDAGIVVHETLGMPTVRALRQLALPQGSR